MKQLAEEHGRSLNKEIVQACKAWIVAERGTHMSVIKRTNKDVYAEIGLISAEQDAEMGRLRQVGIARMEQERATAQARRWDEFERRMLEALPDDLDLASQAGKDFYWKCSLEIGLQLDHEGW